MRNREAVVEAVLALVREGRLAPTADEVAERSGVSARSVFRYFDDVDDLCRAAIEQQIADIGELAELTVDRRDSLDRRVGVVVDQRLALYEAIGNVGRVTRLRAPFQPLIAAALRDRRAEFRAQLAAAFEPELSAMPADRAAATLAAADVLCSFESYELLRGDQQLSPRAATRALAHALVAMLRAGTEA